MSGGGERRLPVQGQPQASFCASASSRRASRASWLSVSLALEMSFWPQGQFDRAFASDLEFVQGYICRLFFPVLRETNAGE